MLLRSGPLGLGLGGLGPPQSPPPVFFPFGFTAEDTSPPSSSPFRRGGRGRGRGQGRCSFRFRLKSDSEEAGPAAADDDEYDWIQGGRQQQNNRESRPVLLVEKYQDGTEKRYSLDANSQLQAILKKDSTRGYNTSQKENVSGLSGLPSVVREFMLPAGFPGSVSDDYLEYMLWQFPTNVTGWMCHTLVTSSLLKAVGVGIFTSTSAAASAVAVRWVSKDGLGAFGRLIIGGRFGKLFDDDPKQWRLYADFIGSAGSIFELSTQLYSAYFLPLAALGNFTKEEVWEVTAQLLGLAAGIIILGGYNSQVGNQFMQDIPGIQTSYAMLAFTWLSLRILHLWLRYQSLSVLRFRTINLKRARVLVKSHVLHHIVPGYIECNKKENILYWERFLLPRVTFGTSMEKMMGSGCSSDMMKALLKLYREEEYILFVNPEQPGVADFLVAFKVGATGLSVLKSLWHAHWLHEHLRDGAEMSILSWLEQSLAKLEEGFADFQQQLQRAGWEEHQIMLKVSQKVLIFEEAQAE